MAPKIPRLIFSLFVLAAITACSVSPSGPATSPTATVVPFVPETGGPPGFSASLATPDVVQLTWETVPDATEYLLQLVVDGLAPLTIAYLPPDSTSFTHLLAPESSLLTYRLQTLTASGSAGASSLQIATQAHQPNPLAVQASFSEGGLVSAVIGPEGGTLETTDDRGVTYTLVIPAQALDYELEIKMTPMSAIDGWPLDGNMLGGVQLQPEGWLLNEVAYLTIHAPSSPGSGMSPVGFAFDGSGQEFHLTPAHVGLSPLSSRGTGGGLPASPVRQDAGAFSLPIMELKSTGVGAASADSASQQVMQHAPTDSRAAADQKAAATDAVEEELTPLWPKERLAELFTGDLLAELHFGVKNCSDFRHAVASFETWEVNIAELGDPGGYSSFRDAAINELAEKAVQVIENAGQECKAADKGVVPASIPCAERLLRQIQSAGTVPGEDPFYKDLQNAITADTGLKDRMVQADSDTKKCPHSFGVVESAQTVRWTSPCIPSLNRPYTVGWVTPYSTRTYWLFPASASDPFSGRVAGYELFEAGGTRTIFVIQGNYTSADIVKDNRGSLLSLTLKLTFVETVTSCAEGVCGTASGNPIGLGIPLTVRNESCSPR